MDKETNIMKVGRRMPYKVPDGMFDDIERNVLTETGCAGKSGHCGRIAGVACALAASLALVISLSRHIQSSTVDSFAEVQEAFADLDNADQIFLKEVYNEDTFLNINY